MNFKLQNIGLGLSPVLWMLVCFAVLGASACSRKKDGFTNRLYHSTTTHYNWFYNASEIIRLTELQLKDQHLEDYDTILPLFYVPDLTVAQTLAPEMDRAIEKCGVTIERHSMQIRKKEYNKFIDDCYLVVGKANFYKRNFSEAEKMFVFVAKKYKDQETRHDAALWLARLYVEEEEFTKAFSILNTLKDNKADDVPEHVFQQMPLVRADMFMRQARWEEAVPELQEAIARHPKLERARLTFILGQVFQQMGNSDRAISTYAEVLKMRPEYDLEFQARIRQALAYNRRMGSTEIRKMLNDMLEDKKYEEYRDQILYALAEVDLQDRKEPEAIANFKESASISKSNKIKAKSFIRLADLYMENRDYRNASNYYDSTVTTMSKDHPKYLEMEAKAESLDELVSHLVVIDLQDSLLALSAMDEKEREKKILRMMADMREEEERQAALKEAAQNAAAAAGSASGPTLNLSNDWYFYNSNTMSAGRSSFANTWGNRPLEDNWRRASKERDSRDDFAADTDSSGTTMTDAGGTVSSVGTLEGYLANVPLTDSAVAQSHRLVAEALYNSGVVYKEKLLDIDNSIESFSRVITDYDTSMHAPPAAYQLYRIYYDREQEGGFLGTGLRDNSAFYKDFILENYPETEYARLIADPDYFKEIERDQEADRLAYEEIYLKYTRRQYNDVLMACNTVINDEPGNSFLPKYYLIKALSISGTGQAEGFRTALEATAEKFPTTEEGEKARELLGMLNKAQPRDEPATTQDDKPATTSAEFDASKSGDHFYGIVVPKTGLDINALKNKLSDFNLRLYSNQNLRVTNSFIDKDHQILIVRTFKSAEEAMEYHGAVNRDQILLEGIDPAQLRLFAISTKNFTQLFRSKNLDGYTEFFTNTYF